MSRRALAFVGPLSLLAACTGEAVAWRGDARPVSAPSSDASRLELSAEDVPTFASPPTGASPVDSLRCDASLRIDGPTTDRYAVWWSRRANGSALLLAARSTDGGITWNATVPVDTLDRATVGCDRPAPSVAVASRTGYVHIVYALAAPEGTGIFFSHSMEHGALYHAPVSIAYGERLARARIAAQGDTVLVVYEEPSASTPRIAAALSRSSGHLFEQRFIVTAGSAAAVDPRVAVRDSLIAVSWREPDARDRAPDESSVSGAVGEVDAGGATHKGRTFVKVGRLNR